MSYLDRFEVHHYIWTTGTNPRTGRWAPRWKPGPDPDQQGATRRMQANQFQPGDPRTTFYARLGGSRRSRAKRQAVQVNAAYGGVSRSLAKQAAARGNGLLGGRPRISALARLARLGYLDT